MQLAKDLQSWEPDNQCFDLEFVARSIATATGVAERQVRTAIELLAEFGLLRNLPLGSEAR